MTQSDRDLRSAILTRIVEMLDRPCGNGDMPDNRNDELDAIIAAYRLASQADQGVIHPDRLGHAADAIQDACRIHLGAIIRSDGASKIARYVLAHIDKMNAEYATHPQPQPSKGEGA